MYIKRFCFFTILISIFLLFELYLQSLNSNVENSSTSLESNVTTPEYKYSNEFYLDYLTSDILKKELKLKYSLKLGKAIPVLWKSPYLENLDCKRLLRGDKSYMEEASKNRHSYSFVAKSFPVSCEDIKLRGYYPDQPLTLEEAEFPLAFAINVFHDYLKIEQYFLLMYAPQNQFCYAIDKKATPEFKKKIRNLEKCFENVYVVEKEYSMDHSGVNGNLYNYECMKLLNNTNYKYLFLLQNDDVPLKTNHELVQILKVYNGSVDMDFGNKFTNHPINVRKNVSLKFKDLNVFREGDPRLYNPIIMNSKLQMQKGFLEASLPREAIDYMLNVINISTIVNNLNSGLPFTDEILWPTIMTSPELAVPGWQHYKCSKNSKFSRYYYTRRSLYIPSKKCITHKIRHGLCLLGVELLHDLKSWPQFFGNKFYSEFDFGASTCWTEYLYEKKYFAFDQKINVTFYMESPLIKYQKLKKVNSNLSEICNLVLK